MHAPFQDSLDRLHDIHEIEASRADAPAWAALPSDARRQKEQFYASQQHTTRGFLRMAVSTLKWLNTMAEHPGVVSTQVGVCVNSLSEQLVTAAGRLWRMAPCFSLFSCNRSPCKDRLWVLCPLYNPAP